MSDLDEAIKTRFNNDKHRLMANIVYTANWIKNGFSDFLAPYGLSSPQFNILRILRGAGDWVSMNDIKKVMIDKSPHTTRLTTKLLDKGLIERKRSTEDRRVVYVSLTEQGIKLLDDIDNAEINPVSFLEKITMEEAETVNSILDKLRN